MSLAEQIGEALKGKTKKADQIAAMVDFIQERDSELRSVIYDTGIPGAIATEELIAPGITIRKNGNGSIVEIEIES